MRRIRTILKPISIRLKRHPLAARLALGCIPDVSRTIDIAPIGPFSFRLRRNRSFWLRDPLDHEHFPLGVMRHLIRSGDTVFDVGANIGMYVRFAVSAFGAERVVAFEPMAENRRMLEKNIRLGGLEDRVTVLPYALSDTDQEALLQVDDVQSGTAALDSITRGAASEGRRLVGLGPKTETVQCRTLDGLLAAGKIPEPQVMKIDVEGAERLVLQGAREFLSRGSPRLMIDLHGAEVARDVASFLLGLGLHVRGQVSPDLSSEEFTVIDEGILERVRRRYDLRMLTACRDPAALPDQVEPYGDDHSQSK